jgi:carbamoyl-phosphate synthase large subunit
MVVIEMNPRVSRSSALASKATGYPIARVATQLALGYTLDELPNRITQTTPAAFEPALDYVVVKIPRWSFDKFRETDPTLSTHMKSIGEVMAIGRTFKESLQKALRSVEIGRYGLLDGVPPVADSEALKAKLATPNWERLFYTALAFQHGLSVEEVYELSGMDPWFLEQIAGLVATENRLRFFGAETCPADLLAKAKVEGFADRWLCKIWNVPKRWSENAGRPSACDRSTSAWTPAPANSKPRRPTFTAPTRARPKAAPWRERRSLWWVRVPTGWGRVSSSTTVAARRCSVWGTRGTRPSW